MLVLPVAQAMLEALHLPTGQVKLVLPVIPDRLATPAQLDLVRQQAIQVEQLLHRGQDNSEQAVTQATLVIRAMLELRVPQVLQGLRVVVLYFPSVQQLL